MELILKTNNENSIAKIIALAKQLNVVVERRDKTIQNISEREALKQRILNFDSVNESSFGDAAEWQRNTRDDRDLPFSK